MLGKVGRGVMWIFPVEKTGTFHLSWSLGIEVGYKEKTLNLGNCVKRTLRPQAPLGWMGEK